MTREEVTQYISDSLEEAYLVGELATDANRSAAVSMAFIDLLSLENLYVFEIEKEPSSQAPD